MYHSGDLLIPDFNHGFFFCLSYASFMMADIFAF